ncbi:MAG: type IV conjugative transfer system protein TraE [Alphaproteobacteria bacterium]|nr:type IV conjugative transfer system protein TraE [Alphaproteobacteria bacterium]OJV44970.1 MAG: type IV conjugative transfer system protein TraE [Alphaproteobacteria bacterium 43-37]
MKHVYTLITLKNLFKQRNSLLAVVACLAIANLVLVVALVKSNKTIVLVPPSITKELSFRGSSPSESYLEEMSLFFISLILDNSEASFPFKSHLILRYTSPEYYNLLKKELLDAQERYKNEGLTTHFRPTEMKVDVPNLLVTITGEMNSFVASIKVTSVKQTYCIGYTFQNGFLSIASFKAGEPL